MTLRPAPAKNPGMSTLADPIQDMVRIALGHTVNQDAMIVYDLKSELSCLLSNAYRTLLPEAKSVDFHQSDPETIMSHWDLLSPGDLVVLIQSTSFRLSRFRIRLSNFRLEICRDIG